MSAPSAPTPSSAAPSGAGAPNPERERLASDARRETNWKRWGPYLSERQWGTVREDYSPDGDCWAYFTHEQSRSRAYRWGEDGLLGICDRECRLCLSVALWNGKDPILKERLYGLTGPEGNHGEDVKEEYFYLDSTPTHSLMRALYKYPQAEFPYKRLLEENKARTREQPEFEISDTGIFDEGRYFDVLADYAKAGGDDILLQLTITNRGPEAAPVHVLPTLWFRNTWSWGGDTEENWARPRLSIVDGGGGWKGSFAEVRAEHETLGEMRAWFGSAAGPGGATPRMLFTENDSNLKRLFGASNPTPYVKDAFHETVIGGKPGLVNPAQSGTKAAAWYQFTLKPGESATIRIRLASAAHPTPTRDPLGPEFDSVFEARRAEAERFYSDGRLGRLDEAERTIARQAYAGLLWSKQFYQYIVKEWLKGDPNQPAPPPARAAGRNSEWDHLHARDVISMPDKWEYPWFAAWDLAFHCVAIAHVDKQFAKDQLLLMMREWYMHPSGAIPAYEFAFGDVNPPVHAWACWRVYKITGRKGVSGEGGGGRDRVFLARAFHKLLLNFTWWVNRKDPDGKNVFGGGFLGLDNIGVFDRSRPLPTGGTLEQADGTAWMAFFCGTMMSMALELAGEDPAYEDVASKFFEHFIAIVDAMNTLGGSGLWDEQDGFYYDQLRLDGHEKGRACTTVPLRVRSMVGVVPLLAAEIIEERQLQRLPGFAKRARWFMRHRTDLSKYVSIMAEDGAGLSGNGGTGGKGGRGGGHEHALLAIPSRERLRRVIRYVFDESEFLSPYGLRSVSKVHAEHPFVLKSDGEEYRVGYVPGESTTSMFGGNSNWRGPVWFPLNYLFIEALERYAHFYGESATIEYPTGSGRQFTLWQVADDLRTRMARLFLPDSTGRRPCMGDAPRYAAGTHNSDLVLFHEYFHAETGKGLGASHQTGWTALIAPMLRDLRRSQG